MPQKINILKCKQCGASVDALLTCPYCGAKYATPAQTTNIEALVTAEVQKQTTKRTARLQVVPPPIISDRNLNSMIKNTCSPQNLGGTVFVFGFMVLWCIIAFFIGNTARKIGAPTIFQLVPYGMGILGIIIFLSVFVNLVKFNIQKELGMCQRGNYQDAYNSLKNKNDKKAHIEYQYAMIIIGYYRIGNYEEVKGLIHMLNPAQILKSLSSVGYTKGASANISVIAKIAKNMGVPFEMQITRFTGHNSIHDIF